MKLFEKLLLNEKFILCLIILNSIVIFLQGFSIDNILKTALIQLDNTITLIFLFELVFKVKALGFSLFIKSKWNIFDAFLIIIALPSLYYWIFNGNSNQLDYLLILRISRLFKFFRLIKFFPNINHMINGVQRALKASIVVLLGFLVYTFIVSVLSCFFYRNIAPENFANPLISFYSIFKIFTVEGWYEIPDYISTNSCEAIGFLTKIYFIIIVFTGGILGLSLVNSIFVDAMVSDNNADLEREVKDLNLKIGSLEKKIDNFIDKQLNN